MHIRSIAAPLLKWFARNARDLPWRRTRDPYAIWVSEIMLQQTQVKTVIPYWQRWMKQLPDIASLAAADEDTVIKLWEGLGYYSRARNLQKAARMLSDEFGGTFPETAEELRLKVEKPNRDMGRTLALGASSMFMVVMITVVTIVYALG